ncbi:hypothetical protein N5D61_11050 [Pseudomonas sp. GD03842]|uniref:hypothetical protein n=1 Tax=unclassified Pseudomonas TaxID=196821 RepID=UPI000D36DA1E|nr:MULTISPECIES: hypothetical protein [unclassified Pseudomonas]MDH0746882.1 hypothetical protein [Pseudomonas sp. GD03842]RAU43873.1 hypothetical protein DBP26_018665 [Pseudomonas sp. RIT 409]RAU56233.1 hypothetical protein DBY65_003680 [Pseudomonas sp. RIT 412]
MKMPLIGALAAMTLAVSTAAMATESNTQESVSGAPDSTVMTQTKTVEVAKKQHKQVQADENKRGRPTDQTSHTSN